MTTTRCKVRVSKVTPLVRQEGEEPYAYSINIGAPPYDPNPESENGRFFQATPGINIQLGVVNPAGAAVFKEGRDYYCDFTECNPE